MTADQHTNLRGFRVRTSGFARGFYFVRASSQIPHISKPLCAAAVLVIFISLLQVSCASHPVTTLTEPETIPDTSSFIPAQFSWQETGAGIDYAYVSFPHFPVRYHAVRINLTKTDLSIAAFPSSENDFRTEDGVRTPLFTGKRTPLFAKECAEKQAHSVTINTSPFAGKTGQWNAFAKITRTRRIVGTHIVNGKELASPAAVYAALVFKRAPCTEAKGTAEEKDAAASSAKSAWTAEVIDSQTETALSGADFAFGGFFTILRDGVKKSFAWTSSDSRSAAGVSKDGRTLYMLVVEGENKFQSAGLSFPECAAVLAAMGADDALEFDGGGSSCLCVNGKSVMSYPVLRTNAASMNISVNPTK